VLKLFYSATSPFVRKVVVAARERGLMDRLEFVPAVVVPTEVNAGLAPENPLMKVPTLVLEDGEALFDSGVIVEYLDTLHDLPPLIPPPGPARWRALRIQALADGLLDAAVLVRYETFLRPEPLRWSAWVDGQMRKVRQALAGLAAESLTTQDPVGLAEIAVACTLGYLDFRYPDEDWRTQHPGLAAFDSVFADRPSMTATRPPPG
jgi:glutathione S-transferase